MRKVILSYLSNSLEVKKHILNDRMFINKIEMAAKKIIDQVRSGGKIMFAGNGGSAADSQHLAAEFVSRFTFNRPPMAAVALTTDTSILTAIGNDYGFQHLFERQVDAIGQAQDVFIGISTSGNSENVVRGISMAKSKNIFCIGLTGEKVSEMNDLCDLTFNVPSLVTAHIQECHIMIGHLLCLLIEEELYARDWK